MSSHNVDEVVKKLSKGLSKTEVKKLESAIKKPNVLKQFQDPMILSKVTASFKDLDFRNEFYEYPLSAINNIGRKHIDPKAEIFRKK